MDTSDDAVSAKKESADQQRPVLDVGATLREARERLGMSVHDVAERIKFAPRQVEALEANDFTHLPEAAFLRGFVRSYARVLHLDEVALISALPADPSRQVAAKMQAANVVFPNMQSLRRINVLWLAGALVIALVLGSFVLLHEGEPTAKPTQVVVESVTLPKAEVAVSAVAETEVQAKNPEVTQAAEPDKPTERSKPEQPVVKPAPQIETAAPVAVATVKQPKATKPVQTVVQSLPRIEAESAPVATAKPPIPLEVLKRRPLHLVFIESAWAEVIDAHGVVLLSRNNPRGTEKWVGGPRHEPYDISIAHPANVKLFFRGKEIDLSAYAGMDVAHLKVE
ncbi:cytoskeleton protein RodZ [mine drainage metagenome]|uniref:Cytoskeleton protein RodZ n=1 Tax=mine drainage metagenome TaxID=410659 RepID=A0A1J5S0D3_9ZZZZ